MTNKELERVERLARDKNLNLSACPTCFGPVEREIAPGIKVPGTGTYRFRGNEHHCDCLAQDRLRKHYLLSEIPRNYWTLGWDDFFGDINSFDAARNYLDLWENWKRHGVGIDFYAQKLGVGKTMLSVLIGKDLIQRGEKMLYIPFRDVVRLVYSDEREERLAQLRHIPVLILDEIGAGWSDAQRELFANELEGLIRWRTDGNSVTIGTTNMTPYDLDQEYKRVFSLLSAKQIRIEVTGMDARQTGTLHQRIDEYVLNGEQPPIV